MKDTELLKAKKRRLAYIKKQRQEIESRHPHINLKDSQLRRDFEKYWNLTKEMVHLTVDISYGHEQQ